MPSVKETLSSYLERPRAIRTLLSLLDSKNKGLDQILTEIGGSKSTGMRRIKELVKMGLVSKKASQTENRKMFYCLEEKGLKIAKILKELLDSVEERH